VFWDFHFTKCTPVNSFLFLLPLCHSFNTTDPHQFYEFEISDCTYCHRISKCGMPIPLSHTPVKLIISCLAVILLCVFVFVCLPEFLCRFTVRVYFCLSAFSVSCLYVTQSVSHSLTHSLTGWSLTPASPIQWHFCSIACSFTQSSERCAHLLTHTHTHTHTHSPTLSYLLTHFA
jgi:hypothetical protein